ncbi:hypothetical protein [Paraclostridium sordellii]|uniref:hypothetical protein n=1 Tax=Paraclostridium sordellii TaxID=1505 RepID=UPI0005EA3FF4|nr:hypothetical protein [Paeniclostridium sordellii]CEQ16912.1 Uncharacterised protein [[Clostridium] sordellii] [Paeniclostridium sordellii]CEQ26690.1 Uncharacterised protein [[Clostridium] sordellii] [Paeniclostridium sordellii]
MSEKKQNLDDLDFLKLNETLANPEFANWYYNQVLNGTDANLELLEFVDIVKNYSEGKYEN